MIHAVKTAVFKLSSQESFVIELPQPLHETCPCLPTCIRFVGEQSFDITEGSLLGSAKDLHAGLEAALFNRAQLHPSIDKDIGYLWNQELHGDGQLPQDQNSEGSSFWVGQKFLVWSSGGGVRSHLAVWIFNNKNGEIILEITPTYPWRFMDPEPGENYIEYEEFMRSYQPLLVRIIPRDIAERWLIQADHLIGNLDEIMEWQRKNPRNSE